MKEILATVATGATLPVADAERAFEIIMTGGATPAQIGAFLMALRLRGETVDEITGAVRIMRAKALHIEAPKGAIDIVGTGGDGSGSFNVSTGTAIVVAGCGVPVAKHGNRAVSSKSGAADVLTALGVNNDADMKLVKKAIHEAGIGFLMAPRHHSAMRHVGPVRADLGLRTIFNILGPLSNPANVKRQFTGAFSRQWIVPMAQTLANLGCEAAWVVHGSDGLDELTTTGPSHVAVLEGGKVREMDISPKDAGLPTASAEDLRGGSAEHNAHAIRDLVAGKAGAYRDIVLFNAAGALIVAGKVTDLKVGVAMAAESIASGKAKAALDKLVAITNEAAPAEA